MDGGEIKEIKEVTPQWWAGTRGHWHPTELCLEMTAVKRPNQQQNLWLIFSYQTQHQKGRKIRMEKRKNKFLNQKEGRDVQLLREGTGRAVVAVLHPNPRTNSSRSKSSKPCTVFPCRTSGAFKKTPRKLRSRPKLLLFYHLSYWQENEEVEGEICILTSFAGHKEAKSWWRDHLEGKEQVEGWDKSSEGVGSQDGHSSGGRMNFILIFCRPLLAAFPPLFTTAVQVLPEGQVRVVS